MARPNKETLEKLEKIKRLKLFTRDNDIYTEFEETTKDMSVYEISYVFNRRCANRSSDRYFTSIESYRESYAHLSEYLKIPIEVEKLKRLEKIDEEISKIYISLICTMLSDKLEKEKPFLYEMEIYVFKEEFQKIFNKEELEQAFRFGVPSAINLHTALKFLSKKQIERLKKYYFNEANDSYFDGFGGNFVYQTIIKKNQMYRGSIPVESDEDRIPWEHPVYKNKSCYVELDFTKPKEELIEIISNIKDRFDNDPSTIKNLYELLGDTGEIYKCNLGECDIYKKDKKKPIGGKFADIFFIYDCKKIGLDNKYIIDELYDYWLKKKNIEEGMTLKTLQKYHKMAKEYIDEKKFKCYFSGYNTDNLDDIKIDKEALENYIDVVNELVPYDIDVMDLNKPFEVIYEEEDTISDINDKPPFPLI